MARYGKMNSRQTTKRRGLTDAQKAAHDAAYAACDHTVEGRFTQGDVIVDSDEKLWKVATHGISYHEDVSTCLYGVVPATRGPKGWRETCEIREAMRQVAREGTHTPGSRGIVRGQPMPVPECTVIVSWIDETRATVNICDNDVVYVVRPISDDSPIVQWVQDARLNRSLRKLIGTCPAPVLLPEASVRERMTKLKIDASNPRFAAYSAARGATFTPAAPPEYNWQKEGSPAELKLPRSEYRRIKAELDAAGT